jgi:rRNA-processing protein FCF1
MGITYNKQLVTKDRRVMPSGPRDRQMKQKMQQAAVVDSSALIEELRHQITTLQNKLDSAPQGGYTAEQVNDEIEKAIKAETADLKAKVKIAESEVKGLNQELNNTVKAYESRLKEKDDLIKELKERKPETDNNVTTLLAEATKKIEDMSRQIQFHQTGEVIDADRPQMETVFVDPIEKESKVETHFGVEIEDVSITKKEEMNDKVGKLKNLLGKLPSKR